MTVVEFDNTLVETLKERYEGSKHHVFRWADSEFFYNENRLPGIRFNGEEYLLPSHAFRGLCNALDIPVPYASRIPEDLVVTNVNYFLSHAGEASYAAVTTHGDVRGFMRPEYPFIPAYKIFAEIEGVVGHPYDLKYVKDQSEVLSYVILPEEYMEPIDGSNVYGGLRVVYSETWNAAPRFDAFIWRELCSNGMIEPIKSRKFRINGSSEPVILRQVREFAETSLEKLPGMIDSFKKLLEEQVADWRKVLDKICIEYKIPNKVKKRLIFFADQPEFLYTISGEEITNMHDLVNLLTFVGTHDLELTDDNREYLLEVAASITMAHDDRCGSCGSVV